MTGFTGADEGTGTVLFYNARVLCPRTGRDEHGYVLVESGLIAGVGSKPPALTAAVTKIDCGGHVLCPGAIDCQVFTGEPGTEHRETLATASRAAAAGGVTAMLCMPNTDPVIDDVALVHYMRQSAKDTALIRVYPAAALTKGLEGREMTEIGLLKEAGAIAFSNGKRSVSNAKVLRMALAYAKDFDALVIHQTEDRDLADGGVMNEGKVSAALGLQGIPAAAEAILLDRDLRIFALTGGRYHVAAMSSSLSLLAVRDAKARGLPVTCGVPVANLIFTDNDIGAYRTYFKVKPPLRTEDDRRSLVGGLRDGTIDVIVSNHDPQDTDLKRRPFDEAADGAVGLETMLPAALQLVLDGEAELLPVLGALTSKPALLLRLPSGRIEIGAPADLARVDLDSPWRVDASRLHSRSKNSPFDDRVLGSKVIETYIGGNRVYRHGEP